ncbi:MAG: hypothetical protein KJ057_17110 [Phycisphaerae bacterium]|nr:hypothetical protein [Planctomycetia bacterium]MCL4720185.1 hypothetical protein [Phycisphaerae bacterium]
MTLICLMAAGLSWSCGFAGMNVDSAVMAFDRRISSLQREKMCDNKVVLALWGGSFDRTSAMTGQLFVFFDNGEFVRKYVGQDASMVFERGCVDSNVHEAIMSEVELLCGLEFPGRTSWCGPGDDCVSILFGTRPHRTALASWHENFHAIGLSVIDGRVQGNTLSFGCTPLRQPSREWTDFLRLWEMARCVIDEIQSGESKHIEFVAVKEVRVIIRRLSRLKLRVQRPGNAQK